MTTPHRDFTVEPVRHFFTLASDPSNVEIVLGFQSSRDVTFTTRIRFPEGPPAQLVVRSGLRGCSLSDRRFRALNARTS